MRFVDLFAGLGGFHVALSSLDHECVFASEIDPELQSLYKKNFRKSNAIVCGDIRFSKSQIPPHDILCAGFPCQPFSKSGSQAGIRDSTRGTLFYQIIAVLRAHHPQFVILENVGNFERHDRGSTWATVRSSLEALDYYVRGTEHVASGGYGLISPHHFGYPHTRERFFVVASKTPLPLDPFPRRSTVITPLRRLTYTKKALTSQDIRETRLTAAQIACVDLWDEFLRLVPEDVPLPSFPIWADELDATYPFEDRTPATLPLRALKTYLPRRAQNSRTMAEALGWLPGYARESAPAFPSWKKTFIRQNRHFFCRVRRHLTSDWVKALRAMPASYRKFEWNCQGEERRLWKYVLQFRPSGLRAKRYVTIPALISMTTTQVPILGPKHRFITRREGLRLQSFPDGHRLPRSRSAAFAALGNAVHVQVAKAVASRLLQGHLPVVAAAPSASPKSRRNRNVGSNAIR